MQGHCWASGSSSGLRDPSQHSVSCAGCQVFKLNFERTGFPESRRWTAPEGPAHPQWLKLPSAVTSQVCQLLLGIPQTHKTGPAGSQQFPQVTGFEAKSQRFGPLVCVAALRRGWRELPGRTGSIPTSFQTGLNYFLGHSPLDLLTLREAPALKGSNTSQHGPTEDLASKARTLRGHI